MTNVGKEILSWWGSALNRETPRGRALSARLRRGTVIEILCEPEVHELSQKLNSKNGAQLACLVSVLAEVRDHTKASLAYTFGGSDPIMSNLRFQRLMRSRDDELAVALKRAIRMSGHRCNVASLGEDLLFWNEKTRMRWCFHYFGAEAPKTVSEEISE